jgi:hypothetical protein
LPSQSHQIQSKSPSSPVGGPRPMGPRQRSESNSRPGSEASTPVADSFSAASDWNSVAASSGSPRVSRMSMNMSRDSADLSRYQPQYQQPPAQSQGNSAMSSYPSPPRTPRSRPVSEVLSSARRGPRPPQ